MTVQRLLGLVAGLPLLLLLAQPVGAQNVQVNPGAGDYPTLKAAFDAINAGTHTGAITIAVTSDTTETVSAVLNASGVGGASYSSIVVTPTGARTISGAIPAGSPLIDFVGADNVTVNGLNAAGNSLVISNTTVAATSGTSTIRFQTDATNNTLTNLSILGSANMGVATNGGNIVFGAASTVSGSDNNIISNNLIGPAGTNLPSKGIYCNGTPTNQTLGNSGIIVTNNQIFDVFAPGVASAGIHVAAGCNTWTITNNRFFQTGTRTFTGTFNHRVIDINGTAAASGTQANTITGNIIGYASAAETGTYTLTGSTGRFAAIWFNGINAGVNTTINNNRINQISMTGVTSSGATATTFPFAGIMVQNGRAETNGNTIGEQGTTGAITFSTTTTSATNVIAMYNFSVDPWVARNNSIGSITANNAGATGAFIVYGMRADTGSTLAFSADDNTIGGTVTGSIQNNSTSITAQVMGMVSNNAITTARRNVVRNLQAAGGTGIQAAASVIGMAFTNTTPSHLLEDNRISGLGNTNAAAATTVAGIQFTGGPTNVVQRNLIHSLGVASATGIVNGINLSGGTNTIRNNMIALGLDSGGANLAVGAALSGINEFLGTNTIVNNSVLIGGTGVGGSANTFAFNGQQTVNTRSFQNNNFHNARSNGAGTGKHYAIRVGGTGPNPTGLTSNFNNAIANGVGGVFGLYDLADRADLAVWQAATGQDTNSISADPLYVSNINLHLLPASPARNAGTVLAAVTDDFDQDARPGSNALYDIGADEVDGTPAVTNDTEALAFVNPTNGGGIGQGVPFSPQATFRNNGINTLSNVTVRFRIIDVGMAEVYNQTQVIVSMAPGATAPVTFPSTTLNTVGAYSMVTRAELAGDTVIANDVLNGTFNVQPPMAGTYTIGTGGDFTSLTNAGGFFQTLNNLSASANITGNIISDLSGETGANALNPLPGGITLLIRPTGAPRAITGSSAAALITINGADNVTIDGSLTGGSTGAVVGGDPSLRQLSITNTSTAASAVVLHAGTGTPADGAQNFTLRNVALSGQDPLTTLAVVSIGGVAPGSAGADNDFSTVENNSIRRGIYGIYNAGANAANPALGTLIRRNDVAGAGADRIRRVGIVVFNQDGVVIAENNVGGIDTTENADSIGIGIGAQAIDLTSVASGNVVNATIRRNRVAGVVNASTQGWAAAGIALAGGTPGTNTIENNMVSGVSGPSTSPDLNAGIWIAGVVASNTRVLHNSVSLTGDRGALASQTPSYGIAITGADVAVELKNNIFSNTQISSGGGANAKAYAIGTNSATFANLDSNFNLFFASGAQAGFFRSGSLAAGAGTEYVTLAAWQAAIGDDANSLFGDPLFVSASDLHLGAGSPAIAVGSVIPGVSVDFDNDPRGASNREIGADELASGFLVVAPSPVDFGNVLVGATSSAQAATLSNTGSVPLTISALSAAAAPFAQVGGTCSGLPITINAGSNCTITYTFSPAATGSASQQIFVTSDGAGATVYELTGVGAQGLLSINPTSLSFGTITVGQSSANQTVTLSNTGNASLNITTLDAAASPFVLDASSTCGTPTFAIAAGGNCTLVYRFTPVAGGLATQTINVTANAPGSGTIGLSGTGVVPGNLTINPTTVSFGSVAVGVTTAEQTVTLANTGGLSVLVDSLTAAAAPFAQTGTGTCGAFPVTINGGSSCTLTFTFAPTVRGNASQILTAVVGGSPSGTITLQGTGLRGELTISPTSVNFGGITVGQPSTGQTVTLANIGNATLSVESIDAALAPFAQTANTCGVVPFNLTAGTTCTLTYTFTPSVTGPASQNLAVVVSAPALGGGNIALSGNGTQGNLTITPTSLAFGNQLVGTTSNFQVVTLANTGSTSINVTLAGLAPPFVRTGGTCSASPIAIAAGANCTLRYVFQPTAAGAATGTVTVSADAPGSGTIGLTGFGTQGVLTFTPASVNLGSIQVGQTSAEGTVTLANIGDGIATVTALTSATTPFNRTVNGTCSLSLPIVINPGQNCTLTYTFTPLAVGSFLQPLTLTSASPGAGSFELLGQGVFVDDLFEDGFEDVVRLAGVEGKRLVPIAGLLDLLTAEPLLVDLANDDLGPALRVYARKIGGQVEVAFAKRDRDGVWSHVPWQAVNAGAQIEFTMQELPRGETSRWLLSDAIVR